ncbi:hypothetical protein BCR33DRAFT_720520 [Rhizoclosmatium globosum]|uniref:PH domain-containing protein n=1 Tax=Rhizoclosmatium globosum TaxID=329046 RepID=A0A1Y2BVP7_9FUNG|nr:hypothetical protein BCR33DRAFT_720520 [Rhizoclosmatium globosum]|eukprot:ORY38858.1 hypothetical protein BCR33DRAFT_720520 [Rhizoclosmatium globosum]
MQKFVKDLIESQNRRAGEHAANATFIENETLPNLRDLFKEIVSKSMDTDKEWVELDKLLANNRETYIKLTRALRHSIERQKILLSADPDSPINKSKLAHIPKDVPRDPWIANLVPFSIQRFIHTLREEFPKTLEQLVNQQSRILVFEKVVIQLLKPTLNAYFSRRLSKGVAPTDPGFVLLRSLEALDPDKDWELFLQRNKTTLVDPASLENGVAAAVVGREVKYEGMDHSRCQFVKEGTLLRNVPGILRSKGYKSSHFVLTVSHFIHGFAEEKKETSIEVGSKIDVGHFSLGDPEISLYLPDSVTTLANGKEGKEFTIKSSSKGMFGEKLTIKSDTEDNTIFWHDLITSLAVTPAAITDPSPRASISSEPGVTTPSEQTESALIFDSSVHKFNNESNSLRFAGRSFHDQADYDDSDDDLHPSVANAFESSITSKETSAAGAMDSWNQFKTPSTSAAAALENAWDDVNPSWG